MMEEGLKISAVNAVIGLKLCIVKHYVLITKVQRHFSVKRKFVGLIPLCSVLIMMRGKMHCKIPVHKIPRTLRTPRRSKFIRGSDGPPRHCALALNFTIKSSRFLNDILNAATAAAKDQTYKALHTAWKCGSQGGKRKNLEESTTKGSQNSQC